MAWVMPKHVFQKMFRVSLNVKVYKSCALNAENVSRLVCLHLFEFDTNYALSLLFIASIFITCGEKILCGVIYKVTICHLCLGVLLRNYGSLKNISS